MGYLDDILKIKSVKGIEKYLIKYFKDKDLNVSLECMKNPKGVRTFWAINNQLHKFDLKNSFVFYVVKEDDFNELINAIEITLK